MIGSKDDLQMLLVKIYFCSRLYKAQLNKLTLIPGIEQERKSKDGYVRKLLIVDYG